MYKIEKTLEDVNLDQFFEYLGKENLSDQLVMPQQRFADHELP